MGSIRVPFMNEQTGVLMEEKNGLAAALEHMRSFGICQETNGST